MESKINLETEVKLIEAILYLENEPVEIGNLVKITKLAENVIQEAIQILKAEYEQSHHGVELTEQAGGYCFMIKKELLGALKDSYGKKNDRRLSKAAMETLAIIAYSQPVTKAEIENIRGVSCDNMIRLLLQYDLIKEMGKKDAPGKPTQFGTTKNFLKTFRLTSIADLPKLNEVDKERFELR
jgi:segregation and condensation protein B